MPRSMPTSWMTVNLPSFFCRGKGGTISLALGQINFHQAFITWIFFAICIRCAMKLQYYFRAFLTKVTNSRAEHMSTSEELGLLPAMDGNYPTVMNLWLQQPHDPRINQMQPTLNVGYRIAFKKHIILYFSSSSFTPVKKPKDTTKRSLVRVFSIPTVSGLSSHVPWGMRPRSRSPCTLLWSLLVYLEFSERKTQTLDEHFS